MISLPTQKTVSDRCPPIKSNAGMGPRKTKEMSIKRFPVTILTRQSRPCAGYRDRRVERQNRPCQ